jgi:hypothetical protein
MTPRMHGYLYGMIGGVFLTLAVMQAISMVAK